MHETLCWAPHLLGRYMRPFSLQLQPCFMPSRRQSEYLPVPLRPPWLRQYYLTWRSPQTICTVSFAIQYTTGRNLTMQYSIGGDPTIMLRLTWKLAAKAGCILAAPCSDSPRVARQMRNRVPSGTGRLVGGLLEQSWMWETAAPLPTRLLDLGTSLLHNVRLYTTSREFARYIASSHCWGDTGKLQLRTTLQNFASNTDRYRLNLPDGHERNHFSIPSQRSSK
jgi:hypothetical protein